MYLAVITLSVMPELKENEDNNLSKLLFSNVKMMSNLMHFKCTANVFS